MTLQTHSPELSVIVPVYNAAPYLERCIQSILSQVFTDFECILVNDGSDDQSESIIKKYVQLDSRIINIFQEHKGVSAARNNALSRAKGKYITFLDADDFIQEDMYEKLLIPMRKGALLSFGNWDMIDDRGNATRHISKDLKPEMEKDYFLSHYFDMPRPMGGNVWNKIFLHSEIRQKFDENLRIGEDFLFLLQYLIHSKDGYISFLDEPLYHCFIRLDSVTRKNKEDLFQYLKPKRQALDIVSNYDPFIFYYAQREYLDSLYFYTLNKISGPYAKEMFVDYMKTAFLSILKNPSIYWKTKVLYIVQYIFKR